MSSNIRVLIRDHPHRSIALATDSHVLVFRHTPSSADRSANGFYPGSGNTSQTSLSSAQQAQAPRCMVEFSDIRSTDLSDYRNFSTQPVHGTLGLITVNNDVFLCVVSAASRAAMVRPGETVQKILAVDFRTPRSYRPHALSLADRQQTASTAPTTTTSCTTKSTPTRPTLWTRRALSRDTAAGSPSSSTHAWR